MAVPVNSPLVDPRAPAARRIGIASIYVILILGGILIFFVAIAVDMGRVRVAKSQLQTAADAAAFAGVQALPTGDLDEATARAVDVAFENLTDRTPVVLQPNSDIEFGLYRINSRRYTPVGGVEPGGHQVQPNEANAIKVSAKRLKNRATALNLVFARIFSPNKSQAELQTLALAFIRGQGTIGIGIIGLDWIRIGGTTSTDSYNAAQGPYGGGNIHENGSMASNGTITLSGGSTVHGNARPGIDRWVNISNNSTVTGWIAPLDEVLVYPADSYQPPGTNDNALVVPQTAIDYGKQEFDPKSSPAVFPFVPGGAKYVFKSWKMSSSGAQITINGPANIYIGTGGFTMSGGKVTIVGNDTDRRVKFYVDGDFKQTGGSISNPYPNKPGTLTISLTRANSTFDATAQLNGHVYAPLSAVTLSGNATNADFFGWVVGKTIEMKGNSQIHYDESLEALDKPYRSVLVR